MKPKSLTSQPFPGIEFRVRNALRGMRSACDSECIPSRSEPLATRILNPSRSAGLRLTAFRGHRFGRIQFRGLSVTAFGGLALGLLMAGSAAISSKPAAAYTNKYFCAVLNGTPRTFVRTERGNRPIISWVNQVGEWSPLERCIAVSNRFQLFHDHGTLRYVGTGTVNGYPVLCAVTAKGDDCYDSNVLVTLNQNDNRHEVARQLLDTRSLARGRSISLSGDRKLETYVEGETYYDLNLIGELAPEVEESVTPVEQVK